MKGKRISWKDYSKTLQKESPSMMDISKDRSAQSSSIKQTKTFVFELGLQNGTIAIFVADSIFGGGPFIIPAATYSLIMFLTSIITVYIIRKK